MKLLLIIVFLILSLLLPLLLILTNKREKMIQKVMIGLLIYLCATILVNFCCKAIGLSELNTAKNKETYVALLTICITLVLALLSLSKGFYDDIKASNLIYGGFGLANYFIYNMNAYSILLRIGMNNTVEKLSKFYPVETANELITYYNNIKIVDIILLIVELVIVFIAFKELFNLITQKNRSLINYLIVIVGLFCIYSIQYMFENVALSFTCYFIIALILVYKNKRIWKTKI